ncbi:MAG: GNAT family N-acetyltransferase [Fuerstiella sp.]
MNITFRHALADDIDVIVDFNVRLALETEDKQLPVDVVRKGVAAALQLSPEARYFVAECDGRVIGQLMITREWSDWRNGWIAWIQSVYVHADFRGCGVFRQLFEHVKQQLAEAADVVSIRLYVEQDNSTAISTYEKLGFQDPAYRVLEMPLNSGK